METTNALNCLQASPDFYLPMAGWRIYGGFGVCPLTPYVVGHMQAACVSDAIHIVTRKD